MRTATGFTAGPDMPPVLFASAIVSEMECLFCRKDQFPGSEVQLHSTYHWQSLSLSVSDFPATARLQRLLSQHRQVCSDLQILTHSCENNNFRRNALYRTYIFFTYNRLPLYRGIPGPVTL